MKILVRLEVPAIEKSYDVWIPDNLSVSDTIVLLGTSVEKISNHKYIFSGSESLCIRSGNKVMSRKEKILSYDVKNGDYLVLI